MRVVGTIDELFAAEPPVRLMRDRFAAARLDERLISYAVWGRPGPRDALELVAVFEAELASPQAVRTASLADFRWLEAADEAAFEQLQRHLQRHGDAYRDRRGAEAVLRPGGMIGSIVSGFYRVTPSPFPVEVFDRAEPALTWLERGDAVAVFAELEAAIRSRVSAPPLLVRLRELLTESLEDASLASVAQRLSLSTRTLQRHLTAADTSFRAELNQARLERACRLLEDGDVKITAIALEVGCATPQHFSEWFKLSTGMSPTDWRRAHGRP